MSLAATALRRTVQSASRSALPSAGGVRFLNLHEYQSKIIMDKFGVNTQKGKEATTPEGALEASKPVSGRYACGEKERER